MATAEMVGVVIQPDEEGHLRVFGRASGLVLNTEGVEVANLLRHESQPELGFGSPAKVCDVEELDVMIIGLVNGVKMRIFLRDDDYFV